MRLTPLHPALAPLLVVVAACSSPATPAETPPDDANTVSMRAAATARGEKNHVLLGVQRAR